MEEINKRIVKRMTRTLYAEEYEFIVLKRDEPLHPEVIVTQQMLDALRPSKYPTKSAKRVRMIVREDIEEREEFNGFDRITVKNSVANEKVEKNDTKNMTKRLRMEKEEENTSHDFTKYFEVNKPNKLMEVESQQQNETTGENENGDDEPKLALREVRKKRMDEEQKRKDIADIVKEACPTLFSEKILFTPQDSMSEESANDDTQFLEYKNNLNYMSTSDDTELEYFDDGKSDTEIFTDDSESDEEPENSIVKVVKVDKVVKKARRPRLPRKLQKVETLNFGKGEKAKLVGKKKKVVDNERLRLMEIKQRILNDSVNDANKHVNDSMTVSQKVHYKIPRKPQPVVLIEEDPKEDKRPCQSIYSGYRTQFWNANYNSGYIEDLPPKRLITTNTDFGDDNFQNAFIEDFSKNSQVESTVIRNESRVIVEEEETTKIDTNLDAACIHSDKTSGKNSSNGEKGDVEETLNVCFDLNTDLDLNKEDNSGISIEECEHHEEQAQEKPEEYGTILMEVEKPDEVKQTQRSTVKTLFEEAQNAQDTYRRSAFVRYITAPKRSVIEPQKPFVANTQQTEHQVNTLSRETQRLEMLKKRKNLQRSYF
ncbi:hypothetical protein EIN_376140 [Entamoeba invadens IP1]|uniref:Uncharacterized protein n=1 Tax=Entamoeba invadens IP1 TaxID=370355 RepID=A0A0A1TU75_ENTIV|nr:hypothetical protein EIN_376140 [Entamoeba invadens IP1]ELP83469.1 hypothetical protein EIN_376140 [Entamoeba invadens IP1]|eukprot:XP_004182815.1 hypothetical protein EIN_376140 [Entamoeba invadens IP1]